MSFFGKEYILDRQENFDGFLNSLGADIPADMKQALLNSKPTTKLEKNGDTYVLFSSRPNNTNSEVSFKNGQEVEENLAGRAAKSTYTVDGNTVTQVQKFDSGEVLTYKRVFSDSEVVTTITSSKWDGVANRYYKAL